MDALTQQVMDQLTKKGISQISKNIGADKSTTTEALTTMLPLLVTALAKNTSQPSGAQALHQALAKDHDGSILGNIATFLENPAVANGAGILVHVLGDQQSVVTQGLAKTTGLDSAQIAQLMQTAAPILMGVLGQQQQQSGLDPSGLTDLLGSHQQQAQQSNPDLMNVLNTMLDTNKDGSALDDILGMAGKLLGGNNPSN
jgi:hypothetical protein